MKPVVGALAVLFVGLWLVQSPDTLASFTRDGAGWLWELTMTLFASLRDFLTALVS